MTATYNALPGLRETAASVQAQTARDFEHIVVDGASTDGTIEWLAQTPEVTWVSEPDDGIADALNKGLQQAKGEWILVLHADDTLIDQNALSDAIPVLQTSADVISFDVRFSSEAGPRVRRSRGLTFLTNFKTTIPHQGAFCRRSLFDRIGEFDPNFSVAMDYEFFLRAYRAGADVDVHHRLLADMPDTGVSSKRDWDSLRHRFSEERFAQRLHARTGFQRVMYAVYWPLYLGYRKVRSIVSAG